MRGSSGEKSGRGRHRPRSDGLTTFCTRPLRRGSDQTRRGDAVSATVLYMSTSLDGFIAGPNEGPDNGLGDGGHRLHEWFLTGDADHKGISRPAGVNGE